MVFSVIYFNNDLPIFQGHMKSIQCVTVHKCEDGPYIYSGSHDGHINILGLIEVAVKSLKSNEQCWLERFFSVTRAVLPCRWPFLSEASHYWNADNGNNDCFSGKGHTNQVSSMVVNENDELVSCGMDDTLRFTSLSKKEYRLACVCCCCHVNKMCLNWHLEVIKKYRYILFVVFISSPRHGTVPGRLHCLLHGCSGCCFGASIAQRDEASRHWWRSNEQGFY